MNPIAWLLSLIKRLLSLSTPNKSTYSLDHAILNLPVPPPSMWMNMGYWKDASDLPTACAALLQQVLIAAGLLDPSGGPAHHPPQTRFRLVDVGIGCGDQTLELLRARRFTPSASAPTDAITEEALFDSYVGITDLPLQADVARQRLPPHSAAHIYAADAADPTTWPADLQSTLLRSADDQTQTWLLALDTLYHFRPSRRPLLAYANGSLRASFMAFDLLLADGASPWQKLLLWVMCWVARTPVGNFVTRAEYEALLVRAGYALERVEMVDVSMHVFGGLAGFIWRRDRELGVYGLSVGRYRVAARVFDWWARTGVVRGVVVVARL
ncbi:hypothetical protein ATEIFO6365_0005080300 [Aspergillus terreus]|uniref:Uncharacterized protein n=1 Tax=Aspergillus terreus TaxID=33178 RepID=A0A5M3Z5X6_ASPTE|nr:hypothetical protein ATETN484_0007064400 [Aspergillus terreus]GFF16611.1 hypothetical protein ATEIFO6365_0005080300 [Aspergillus terreus]